MTWEEGGGSSLSGQERMHTHRCYWLPSSKLGQSLGEYLMQDAGILIRSGQVSATFAAEPETLVPFATNSEDRHGQMGARSSTGLRWLLKDVIVCLSQLLWT